MSVEVTQEQVANTGHLLAREIAWRAVERQCELPPSDPPSDEVRLAPFWPDRIPILDRRPLQDEDDVVLELTSDLASPDGPNEARRPDRVGARCFLANRRLNTRSALITMRERLIQMAVLNKATQVPMGTENTDAGHLHAMNADLLHDMSIMLTIVEVAVHEEHFFQLITTGDNEETQH